MKKLLTALPLVASLAACSTAHVVGQTSDQYENRAMAERQYQSQSVSSAISQAPEWMSKIPTSNNAVFESATAVSRDWAMADMKAKAIAYSKICMAAGGTASQRTKIYNRDTETSSQELSEMALRTSCKEVDLTGVEVREMKHVADGNRYRTYVLVSLPTGEANVIKRARQAAVEQESVEDRSKKAFKEMDGEQTETIITPIKGDAVSVIKPDGSTSTLNLMPVDNEEYKKKRAEALQKPGAVVGQVTVNN